MARRGHVYPNARLLASDLVTLRVAALPAKARVDEAHARAMRLNVAVLAAPTGRRRFLLRDDLTRAMALGLGELAAHRLGRPLPIVAAGATEIAVRRRLAEGAPAVIVRDGGTETGAVGRSGFMAPEGPSLKDRLSGTLRASARSLLARIGTLADGQGGRAFAVGGVIRNCLMPPRGGLAASADLDIVVEGDGLAVARLLAAEIKGQLVVHERFLTASVQDAAGQRVDIATARIERYESPGALPHVRPAGIADDLRRRDFSVNAMAAELSSGSFLLIDPHGGSHDCERGRLRILHPLSFIEDPTRIFRAARYGARLDLAPDPWTADCLELAIELGTYPALSGHRIAVELELILREPTAGKACSILATVGAFRLLNSRYRDTPGTRARLGQLDAVRAWATASGVMVTALDLLLLAVLGDQDPDVSRAVVGRLGLTGEGGERLLNALGRWRAVAEGLRSAPTRSACARLLRGRPAVDLVAIWLFGDADARREVTRFISHDALIEPWLTGDEILALGVPEGPAVAHVLETLRDARLDGTITDRRAAAAHVRRRAATLETGGAGR